MHLLDLVLTLVILLDWHMKNNHSGMSNKLWKQVIFADGTFIDGSTSELSCDGPLREPFSVFCQVHFFRIQLLFSSFYFSANSSHYQSITKSLYYWIIFGAARVLSGWNLKLSSLGWMIQGGTHWTQWALVLGEVLKVIWRKLVLFPQLILWLHKRADVVRKDFGACIYMPAIIHYKVNLNIWKYCNANCFLTLMLQILWYLFRFIW